MQVKRVPVIYRCTLLCLFYFVLSDKCLIANNDDALVLARNKVNYYLAKGQELSNRLGKPDSLLVYAKKALQIAEKSNLQNEMLESKLRVAMSFQMKNDFDSCEVLLKSILKELKNKTTSPIVAECYYTLGLCSFRSGKNGLAIQYYLKSANLLKKLDLQDKLCLLYCKLASVLINESQPREAKEYIGKCKSLLSMVKDPFTKLTILSGLSGAFIQLGISEKELVDSSIVYAKKALKFVDKYGYNIKGNQLCNSISEAYYLKNDFGNARLFCQQSLLYRQYLLPGEIIVSYLNMAGCYSGLQQYELALKYADSARLELKVVNDAYYDMVVFERLYTYNKQNGNYKDALIGLEKYKAIQDSLYNIDKTTSINELIQRYQKIENEKKISELEKANQIALLQTKFLWVVVFAAVMAIALIVFLYRQSVFKSRLQILETEQSLNRARMNPHFFFNALSSIKTASEDDATKKDVPRLITRFSKIMRQSLENTYDELVTLETEIEFIHNYLSLQQFRYPSKFEFEIKTDEGLATSEIKIPSMLLQVFAENAIEHGFRKISYKGNIIISFKLEAEYLMVKCIDNGTGLKNNGATTIQPSRAIQITRERITLLNKKYKSKASLAIHELKPHGVEVVLILPVLN